jgi:hypothetical protein
MMNRPLQKESRQQFVFKMSVEREPYVISQKFQTTRMATATADAQVAVKGNDEQAKGAGSDAKHVTNHTR